MKNHLLDKNQSKDASHKIRDRISVIYEEGVETDIISELSNTVQKAIKRK